MLEQQLKLRVEQRFQAEVETRITELRTFCLRLSGSEWVADDLLQETLMKVYRSLQQDSQRPVTLAYLNTIARRTWVDFCRKSRLPTLNLEEEWVPTPQDSSMDRVVIKEALESVLHRLPARQAITLLLMDVYAFTAKETAYRIDATEGAVTMALKRARTNVQQLVAGELVSISPPSGEGGRNSELIKQLVLAFERHDPEYMIIAYLKLTSNGMKVKRIVRTGTTLYFAISDPNGIEILVYAK